MMKIGIDAGGTLVKIACDNNGSVTFMKFPVAEIGQVADWLNGLADARICMTGGKAALLQSLTGRQAAEIVEFEATFRGVKALLGQSGVAKDAYILTNVGTGTSIHYIEKDTERRVGGTGVGGGTLMGLSRLLTGMTDFDAIVRLASTGSRDRIDLKVSHIYQGAEPPIPGDLTASNFGRQLPLTSANDYGHDELLASVIGLVGETAATASVLAAGQFGVSTVVYIGSSFIGNSLLKDVAQGYTRLRGAEPIFVANGEYSGAIGAMHAVMP